MKNISNKKAMSAIDDVGISPPLNRRFFAIMYYLNKIIYLSQRLEDGLPFLLTVLPYLIPIYQF